MINASVILCWTMQMENDDGNRREDRCKHIVMAGRSNYDILSSLPLELVVQIVEYLDVTDIIRCQKVQFNKPSSTSRVISHPNEGYCRSPSNGPQYSRPIQSSNVSCPERWSYLAWTPRMSQQPTQSPIFVGLMAYSLLAQ